MTTMGVLAIILALAFLVETLTEAIFGPLFDKIPALTPHKWALMYIALVIGVIGAFVYKFDLLSILSQFVEMKPPFEPGPFGMVITGLSIGKGSNYIHQIISKFFPAKAQVIVQEQEAEQRNP